MLFRRERTAATGFAGSMIDPVTVLFWEGGTLTRALRSNQLWLVVTYVGLLLLMARAYA